MKLLIMRHGETLWNTQGKLQGQADLPLDEEGRKMAVSCGRGMKDVPVDLCISSPLIRATQTADLVLTENREYQERVIRTLRALQEELEQSRESAGSSWKEPKWKRTAVKRPEGFSEDVKLASPRVDGRLLPYLTDKRLMEADFGPWEGLVCKAEGYNVPLEDFSVYWNDPESPLIQEGVERLPQVTRRLEAALADIVSKKSLQDKNILLVVHGCVMRSVMSLMSEQKDYKGRVPLNCEVIVVEPVAGGLKELSREIYYDRSMIHDYYATMKQE